MMGEQRGNQQRLFYSFNLDEHVPADHLLRGINQFLDLTDLRAYLAPFYSHTGRPSIDPELMIRMLIVGYCFGRVERRFGIKPGYLIGDTAYGNAATLGWLVNEKQIDPYIPVWSTADRREEIIPSSDFIWDERKDEYRCPGGQRLRRAWRPFKGPRTHITKAATIIYRSSQRDCASCPMKQRCCPYTPFRKITRSIHEQARDVAREMAKRSDYRQSRRDRKKVEMLFAHFKRILKMDRLRLRGITGARDEFLLAAIAQNLRRMAKKLCPTAPPRVLAYT